MRDALATSIDNLDGTFSFLVSSREEIGYTKDRLAVKPMIMYETDDRSRSPPRRCRSTASSRGRR